MDIGGTIGLFKNAFSNPEEAFAHAAEKKAGWLDGLKSNGVAFLPVAIAVFALIAAGGGGITGGIIAGIAAFAAALVASLLVAWTFDFAAGAMGGRRSGAKANYVLSVLNGAAVGVYIVIIAAYLLMLAIARMVAASAIIVLPVGLIIIYALSAYVTYIMATAVRPVHGMGTLKSIFAYAIGVGLVVTLALVVASVALVALGMVPVPSGTAAAPA